MPIPKRRPNEKRTDYISRLISFFVKEEGLDRKEAIARAYSEVRRKDKK